MPPPVNRDEVLELLFKSELVAHDNPALIRLQEVVAPDASPADTLRPLVRLGLLTPFQAEQLALGKWKGYRIGPYKVRERLTGQSEPCWILEDSNRQQWFGMTVNKQADYQVTTQQREHEVQRLAAINHPNIAKIRDIVHHDMCYLLVWELCSGQSLADVRKAAGGRVPVGEACGFGVQAALAMQAAKGAGVHYCHILPQNIVVNSDGRIKIHARGMLDWLRPEDEMQYSLGGIQLWNTSDDPGIPEPNRLIWHPATIRDTDVRMIGLIVFGLVCGDLPRQNRYSYLPPAHTVCPEVPEDVSYVIGKIATEYLHSRFKSASEVIAALRPFVVPSATRTCPPMAAAALAQLA